MIAPLRKLIQLADTPARVSTSRYRPLLSTALLVEGQNTIDTTFIRCLLQLGAAIGQYWPKRLDQFNLATSSAWRKYECHIVSLPPHHRWLARSGFKVESFQHSRCTLLTAAGAGVLAASLPVGTGLGPSPAVAADNQTNLRNLVEQRFGMFNHFNLGTFTDQEWPPSRSEARMVAAPCRKVRCPWRRILSL